MTTWQPRLQLEAELQALAGQMAREPTNIKARFQHAAVLAQLGHYTEAEAAYRELLVRKPDHFGALNNLGVLLAAIGQPTAARNAYAEAVKHHPDNIMGQTNLANAYAKNNQTELAREHFEVVLRLDPENELAHQGMAFMLANIGETEAARHHQQKGFAQRPIMVVPYCGAERPLVVLLLGSAYGGDVPMLHHLDDHVFFTSVIYVEFYDPTLPFPPHQVVMNVVGDADRCAPALEDVERIVQRTNAPVINAPSAVRLTSRTSNAERFAGLPGVVTPRTMVLPRELLERSDAPALLSERGFGFPLLVRSPGFHTGYYFQRIEQAEELAAALPELPGAELLVIEYLDARGADGKARKYRVMMIDGELYPLHVAVSNDWKVHYFTADMEENAAHRAEDAAFLNHMPQVLGPRAMQALRQLRDALGLDYAGIDFGLDAKGELIVFEANATMVVNPVLDTDPRWDYRRAPVDRILDAVRQMFAKRATPGVLAKITSIEESGAA